VNENWEETESDDELLWGVGDLFLEKDEKEDVRDVSTPRHGSKSGRKKKRQTTDSDEVSSSTKNSKSRRRRKKTQQCSDFA
jgi:calcineurin-like phosphoesterase family protein